MLTFAQKLFTPVKTAPAVITQLPSGLRTVSRRAEMPVEHVGIVIDAGTRDELPSEHGLAHFVEHTIFKGTARRRACHIRDRMETVGGELNAYTTKEETVIYVTAPAGHLDRALELLADLVCGSVFPQGELERERLVVGEEIDSYLDSPADRVFDDFEDLLFEGSPLGHNILGTRESLATFTSAHCRSWLERHYTPRRMMLFYLGEAPSERFHRLAERRFSALERPDTERVRLTPPIVPPFEHTDKTADSHQAHTVLGARVGGMESSDRHALALLANILAGPGMNSLLNVALRERRGLVYSVDASTQIFTDCGLLTLYFGCDPADLKRCLRLTLNTLAQLATSPLTQRQLDAARRQFTGQLTVASVASEGAAISMGRSALYRGRVLTLAERAEMLAQVTPEALRMAAEAIARPSRLTLL